MLLLDLVSVKEVVIKVLKRFMVYIVILVENLSRLDLLKLLSDVIATYRNKTLFSSNSQSFGVTNQSRILVIC